MDKTDYDKYEDEIKDVSEFLGTDININPSFYIHNAILKAQESLKDENIQNGVFKFRFFVENIEILAKSAEMIPADYDTKITDFMNKDEFKSEKDNLTRHFKLANYKMQLLLNQVFATKTTTTPIKA